MTNAASIRSDQVGRLTHAIARASSACKPVAGHHAIASAVLRIARDALSQLGSTHHRTVSAGATEGAIRVLYAIQDEPGVGGIFNHDLRVALGLIHASLLSESDVAMSAREVEVQAAIDALDNAVAHYEYQQGERDIRLSDGADASKLPAIAAYGAVCQDACSLSFGEGTRADPDRCVKCGALFERDAATPFGFTKVAA